MEPLNKKLQRCCGVEDEPRDEPPEHKSRGRSHKEKACQIWKRRNALFHITKTPKENQRATQKTLATYIIGLMLSLSKVFLPNNKEVEKPYNGRGMKMYVSQKKHKYVHSKNSWKSNNYYANQQ